MDRKTTRIGYIGLGAMGGAMARQLLKAGVAQLTVYDVDQDAVEGLVDLGAEPAETPALVALNSDVVITSLPHPSIIESIVLGDNGLSDGFRQGMVYVDMSTSGLESTRDLSRRLRRIGVGMIDAPVGKGPWAAEKGELTVLCGGDPGLVESLRWMFEILGSDVLYCGESGAGQAAKLANNLVSCANMAVLGEAYTLASRAGVDIDVLMKLMPGTSADSWQLRNTLISKILKGDLSPMFKLKLAHKDMTFIQEMVSSLGVDAPGVEATMKWYQAGLDAGYGDMDWGAIVLTENEGLRP